MGKTLVEFKNLKTFFFTKEGIIKAVNDVSFKIEKKQTVGIVGESGCGKSITAMSLMRLVSEPGKIVDGDMFFEGKSIMDMNDQELRTIRGNKISVIFQEPMTSLNPSFTVGNQIAEAIILHKKLSKEEARKQVIEMIKTVGIPDAEKIVDAYPHELSGGMRQRIMIAMAISCNPSLLIADEPTTALDVTIQAQILDLMRNLKEKLQTSIMLITHDLGVVAEMCDHVIVMYAGKIVEEASVLDIFEKPLHPYTKGLLKSKPSLEDKKDEILYSIPGQVPNLINIPDYCYFSDRCPHASDKCRNELPKLVEIENSHKVACWLYEEGR